MYTGHKTGILGAAMFKRFTHEDRDAYIWEVLFVSAHRLGFAAFRDTFAGLSLKVRRRDTIITLPALS